MNTARLFLSSFIILHSSFGILSAAPPPELTVLRTQYEKVLAERVTAPFDAALGDLNAKYTGGLDRAIAEAKQAGDLRIVIAIEAEKKRIADKVPLPDEDDESLPDALKKLRPIYREQLKKLEDQRTASHNTILPAYTARLQALETTLTKGDRVDEAKEVLAYREGLAIGTPAVAVTVAVPEKKAAPMAAVAGAPNGNSSEAARKIIEWALANGHFVTIQGSVGREEIHEGTKIPSGRIELLKVLRETSYPPVNEPPPWPLFAATDTLTDLRLCDWKQTVPAEVFASWAGLKNLSYFQLNGKYDGSVAESLPPLPSLKTLELKLPLTGAELLLLTQKFPQLESMLFDNNGFTDDEFAVVAGWKKLAHLVLSGRSALLTPEKLRVLATMPKLYEMHFYSDPKDTLDPTVMPQLQNIQKVVFSYTAAPAALSAACLIPNLDVLNIGGVKTLADTDFASIARASKLTILQINGSPGVTSAAVTQITQLTGLTELWLTDCAGITVDAFGQLAALKKLKKLVLHKTTLTDESLNAFIKNKALKELGIRDTAVTEAGLKAFKKARPDVKVER